MSKENYRLYSFVASGYLSPLQCGLQTAHAIAEMSVRYYGKMPEVTAYKTWADEDKVIIICAAFNSRGVLDCFSELARTGGDPLGLPISIFFEDEDSLNGAATACAVVVPQKYWDTSPVRNDAGEVIGWEHQSDAGSVTYPLTHPDGQFINHLKQYKLA